MVNLENPYLERVKLAFPEEYFEAKSVKRFRIVSTVVGSASLRATLVDRYSWAIPSDEAIKAIAACSPIIEIGAGRGYWAWLLEQAGADVLAFDSHPPDRIHNLYHSNVRDVFTRVRKGTAAKAADHPERTLFLCWPPYDNPLAQDALDCYTGTRVVFVGEGSGGCTADNAFFSTLEERFVQVDEIRIPQWPGLHDYLTIWHRK